MAEKFYSGRDAKLWFGTSDKPDSHTLQEKVIDWSLQSTTNLLETTTLGDKHKDYIPSLVGYTGSATVLYYKDSSSGAHEASEWLTNAGVSQLTTGVNTANKATLELRLYSDATVNQKIKVNAYLTSASIGVTVGDVVKTSFSFTVCGGPSEATL